MIHDRQIAFHVVQEANALYFRIVPFYRIFFSSLSSAVLYSYARHSIFHLHFPIFSVFPPVLILSRFHFILEFDQREGTERSNKTHVPLPSKMWSGGIVFHVISKETDSSEKEPIIRKANVPLVGGNILGEKYKEISRARSNQIPRIAER